MAAHVTVLQMEPFEKALEALRSEVSFGVTTIRVFRAEELGAAQIGYSISATGADLTGSNPGDWLKSWTVIGCEDACGDPIFVDVAQVGFPVYTAIHGEGAWEPIRIAASLQEFGFALDALADLARGRENPVDLENNPLPQTEKENFIGLIRSRKPDVEIEFWESLLS